MKKEKTVALTTLLGLLALLLAGVFLGLGIVLGMIPAGRIAGKGIAEFGYVPAIRVFLGVCA